MEHFDSIFGYVLALLLIGVVWFLCGFYKKKVIIRWVIQMTAFLSLSAILIFVSIFTLRSIANVFWLTIIFTIGFWMFIAALLSVYFLIYRGKILPKKLKKIEEDLKKRGYDEEQIKAIIAIYQN